MIRIGVDFGGTKIEAAALDPSGRFLARVRAPSPPTYDAALAAVRDLVAEAERKAADALVTQFAHDKLFRIDPAANCKYTGNNLRAPSAEAPRAGEAWHPDVHASYSFDCTAAARFVELQLFERFAHARQIDAQIAAPGGQFKRTLRRPASRLAWDR